MKVLFDLTATQPRGKTRFHGGGEYAKTVFRKLHEGKPEVELHCVYFENVELDGWLKTYLEDEGIAAHPIWDFKEISAICETERIDVFYSALPIAFRERPVGASVRMKGTIHGLRGIECPGDRYAVKYYKGRQRAVRFAKNLFPDAVRSFHKKKMRRTLDMLDALVCVSEHTKYAIKTNFPDYKRDIAVFYTPQKEAEPYEGSRKTEGKYLLLISANRWLKNAYRAILALDELMESGFLKDCRVKIVGKMPQYSLRKIKNVNRFDYLEYVPSDTLEYLYAGCEMFIYPSLNEGFGMPPIEAMKYGKTCVLSAICSLTEIYGDAVYYFNPLDLGEMKTRILFAYENRMDINKIKQKEEQIRFRQEQDLLRICDFIVD